MNWSETLMLSVPLPELLIRGSITFVLLYVLIRIVGRRESAAVGLTDVLVVVLIADAASTGMLGESKTIADGFVVIVVILFWSVVIDALSFHFPWFSRLAKAGPKPLIEDGQLVRRTMKREFMTREEVMTQLRMNGIGDPSEVERAYLEPNGSISIVTREEGDRERERYGKSPESTEEQ
ncbi:DUF421 domain-containing protein [Corynebacterium halotolerans]|uniref:YetF C-terminal domain-containing protein n=1 Tax=Corynebacterium halotolerans YIM 70093 = DSM 44683 TaxID=1121362 RepID=M1P356_9CORY|nr:YetF domain-containing protein [Corynebacterium halotolerans]AGF71116.1 hypothetical protein A605_00500 [Corynebacterium halotolerans YIM 70093 = DSM 44683]